MEKKHTHILKFLPFSLVAFTALFLGLWMHSVHASVTSGTVEGTASSDLVVGAANADYDIAFDTDVTATATTTTITFPAGYTITNGSITVATGVCNDDCSVQGEITVGGVDLEVSSITGNAAARTIAISLATSTNMSTGAGASFRILTGITNATTTGTTGTFSITTDATGESAQTNISGVVLTPDEADELVFTQQPAGSRPGVVLTTQPVVEARDQFGNVDTNFTELVTLTESSAGTLTGESVSAVSGVATFTSLAYDGSEGDSVTLTANDEDGTGSDVATTDAVAFIVGSAVGGGGACLNCAENDSNEEETEDEIHEDADEIVDDEIEDSSEEDEQLENDQNDADSGRSTTQNTTEPEVLTPASLMRPTYEFTKDLYLGIFDHDVAALQAYLNTSGFTVAPTGPGSLGMETTFFGPLTQAALSRLQLAHTILPSHGYFGPKTRAFLMQLATTQ